MTAQVITIGSRKGGVGKTTLTYALAAAIVKQGYDVAVVDLDPNAKGSGISRTLRVDGENNFTIADCLLRRKDINDVIMRHPMGKDELGRDVLGMGKLWIVPGSNSLHDLGLTENLIRTTIAPIREKMDYIILDCSPHGPSLAGPFQVADMIVIPTKPDPLSTAAVATTLRLARRLNVSDENPVGCLSKIKGVALMDVRFGGIKNGRKTAQTTTQDNLMEAFRLSKIGFDTVFWTSDAWARGVGGNGNFPDKDQMEIANDFFNELRVREAPVKEFIQYLQIYQRGKN